jgi:pimeloyl-ACP methyl ester carboxylesterase
MDWETDDGAVLKAYGFGDLNAEPDRRVLIVCGAFLPGLVYAPFSSALVKKLRHGERERGAVRRQGGWGVFVYDRRGKGRSSPVGEGYTLETELRDVATALKASGAKHLFGHSLGGSIVLHAVRMLCDGADSAQHALTPETTTVYDAAINIDGSIDTSWLPAFREAVDEGRLGRAMAMVERRLGMSRTLSHAPTWMLSGVLALSVRTGLRGVTRSVFPAGVAELSAAFQEEATASDFAGLPTRTCFMTGERSAEYFQATTVALAEAVPDSRLVVSPKGLHGSIPAVRHHIVDSLALLLRDRPLGKLDLGHEGLKKLPEAGGERA